MTMIDGLSDLVAAHGVSIVAKATFTLLIMLAAVQVARHSRASVRHLLLAAGFAVLLALPFAVVLAPPVRVDVAPMPDFARDYLADAVFPASPGPVREMPAVIVEPGAQSWDLTAGELLILAWLGGVVLFVTPVFVGLVQVRRLRQTALPWLAGQRLVDALAREAGVRQPVDVLRHDAVPAPATSGFRRHAILCPIDIDAWAHEDVVRAAVHEVEHLRRADCVVSAVTRVICAIYWFHPLVWIAWNRLGLEAERACDDAVLRRAEATGYADQLVTLASRLTANSRHPLLAMANRRDLVRRVAAVLDQRQARGHAGLPLGAAITAAACLLTVVLSPLRAVSAEPTRAAVPLQNVEPAAPPAFEVASIRRNVEGGVPRMRVEAGRFVASNISLRELILDAYRMQSFQVVGGPEWWQVAPGPNRAAPASQRPGEVTFDIIANIPPNTPATQVPLMLKTLLADRFRLAVHTEMREMPVYLLTYARDDKRLGPQLTRSTQQCQAEVDGGPLRAPVTRVGDDGRPLCGMMMSPRLIRGGGLTLTFLTNALTGYVRRPVVDRTGLEGPFDFHLTYAPAARGGGPAPSDDQPSIFTAVQEQLGLKLEPATAPVEVLVVDSVSMPGEN
jgi:uncharacterized protein (TIGR03435 family)